MQIAIEYVTEPDSIYSINSTTVALYTTYSISTAYFLQVYYRRMYSY